jgi:hypothetical protein
MIVFSSRNNSPFGGLGCLIFGILGLVALFYILKGLFYLLWWAAPVLFALALIINWRVVAETGKSFIRLLQRNPIGGVIVAFLSIVGFPLLALYLFLSALSGRRMEQMRGGFGQPFDRPFQQSRQAEDEFVEFEEIESTPKKGPAPAEPNVTDIPIEPPPPPKAEEKRNPYEDLLK